MGADTAINAAKQDTKYCLVLGDAVLVSGFILVMWGWSILGSGATLMGRGQSRRKWWGGVL
jgi:hypothetical protein